MLYLSNQERDLWSRPEYAKLKKCKYDFYEIRFFSDNTQQRPIGFWKNENEFIILLMATEKDRKLIPKNWCDTASDRRSKIIDGTAKTKSVVDDITEQ